MTPYNHSPHQNLGLMTNVCTWDYLHKILFPPECLLNIFKWLLLKTYLAFTHKKPKTLKQSRCPLSQLSMCNEAELGRRAGAFQLLECAWGRSRGLCDGSEQPLDGIALHGWTCEHTLPAQAAVPRRLIQPREAQATVTLPIL